MLGERAGRPGEVRYNSSDDQAQSSHLSYTNLTCALVVVVTLVVASISLMLMSST